MRLATINTCMSFVSLMLHKTKQKQTSPMIGITIRERANKNRESIKLESIILVFEMLVVAHCTVQLQQIYQIRNQLNVTHPIFSPSNLHDKRKRMKSILRTFLCEFFEEPRSWSTERPTLFDSVSFVPSLRFIQNNLFRIRLTQPKWFIAVAK